MYDRREKRRIQRKWAKVVEHIASESMDTSQLPRRLTVYLSAPPADGIVPARDHFHEYVKPILVAAALDWDAVEGRREGDVRAGLAERIRRLRKKKGEPHTDPVEEDAQEVVEGSRMRAGIREWDGIPGDIVVGRHTWKEYIRGLHEGWLGPLDSPAQPDEIVLAPVAEPVASIDEVSATPPITPPTEDASPTTPEPAKLKEEEKPKEEEKKPKKPKQPPPFISTAEYNDSLVSPNCPQALGPTAVVPLPHLLGFLNFPVRMYRFLNRRQVAEDVGRETAAAVLAVYQPFNSPGESQGELVSEDRQSSQWEQQRIIQHEEESWHKSVQKREDGDERERVWLDEMVLDPRIAERMRKFVLDMEAEERAKRIGSERYSDGWFKSFWPKTEEKKNNLWEGLEED